MKQNIIITGCAGFIGFFLSKKLLEKRNKIIGLDDLNNYYDKKLKNDRINILKKYKNFIFHKKDISNFKEVDKIFKNFKPTIVINLAAQAGVRYSLISREPYFKSNIHGFYNILELSKKYNVKKLIFASTSSVYGDSKKFPLKENFLTDKPKSFYAATKKCNEIMAYSYSKLCKTHFIGLRFFTVYGPYGRPDMALYKFVKSIKKNKTIDVFNNGNHSRDFTYIDDIINGVTNSIKLKNNKNNFEILNLCRGKVKKLSYFLRLIETYTEKKFKKRFLPLQKGDVKKTYGSISKSRKRIKYNPKINVDEGIKNFIKWYEQYES
tara:strand:+ start:3628 stop:4593 length:966 start_codon:yes stop_codon:yes gene_type:complete